MARDFKTDVTVNGTAVVKSSRTITATAPVTIAGTTSADLSADRTIAVTAASTSASGVVQLTDSTSSTSTTTAATPNSVKTAYDLAAAAVPTTRTIAGTAPVTINGVSTTGQALSSNLTVAVTAASTSAAGVVQLSDSTSTTGSTKAATETAVKSAYDLAAAAVPKSTVTTAGDLIIATGSAAVTRLAIGADTYVLTSDGTTASWAAPAAGGSTSVTTLIKWGLT